MYLPKGRDEEKRRKNVSGRGIKLKPTSEVRGGTRRVNQKEDGNFQASKTKSADTGRGKE